MHFLSFLAKQKYLKLTNNFVRLEQLDHDVQIFTLIMVDMKTADEKELCLVPSFILLYTIFILSNAPVALHFIKVGWEGCNFKPIEY